MNKDPELNLTKLRKITHQSSREIKQTMTHLIRYDLMSVNRIVTGPLAAGKLPGQRSAM